MKTRHPDRLLIFRGICALAIFLFHMEAPFVFIRTFMGYDITWILYGDGFVFVWIFFILSGYVTAKAFITKRYLFTPASIGNYLTKRIVHIVPAYYVIIFMSALYFNLYHTDVEKIQLLSLLTFRGNYIWANFWDYLWSISVEMQWYLFCPLVCFVLLRLNVKSPYIRYGLPFLIIIGGTLVRYRLFLLNYPSVFWIYLNSFYTPFLLNLDFFLFGVSLNFILQGDTNKRDGSRSKILHFFADISLIMLYLFTGLVKYKLNINDYLYGHYIYLHTLIIPIITMCIAGAYIYSVEYTEYNNFHSAKSSHISRRTPNAWLELLGYYSYEFYLVQIPVLTTLGYLLGPGYSFYTVSIFFPKLFYSFTLCLGCAILLHESIGYTKLLIKKIVVR